MKSVERQKFVRNAAKADVSTKMTQVGMQIGILTKMGKEEIVDIIVEEAIYLYVHQRKTDGFPVTDLLRDVHTYVDEKVETAFKEFDAAKSLAKGTKYEEAYEPYEASALDKLRKASE